MEVGNLLSPLHSLVLPDSNNKPFPFPLFSPFERSNRQGSIWGYPLQHLANLRVKLRLHAMGILEMPSKLVGNVLHFDILLQRWQDLGGLQDMQFLDRVGVDPFLNPTVDGREVRRCSNDLACGD